MYNKVILRHKYIYKYTILGGFKFIMIKLLGVDMGNYNIKTSDNVIFQATYSCESNKNDLTSEEILTYNGKTYYIGSGQFDTELNKSTKDTLPLFLYALGKSTDANVIKVVLGLPVNQFTESNKERMIKKFTGKFNFKLNGEERTIHVPEVKVFMEGVGAYYSISGADDKEIILVDIGGRTTNFAHFYRGKHKQSSSIASGVFNVLDNVKDKLNEDYGLDLDRERAADIIKDMYLEVDEKQVDLSFVTNIKQEVIDSIINELKLNYPTKLATPVLIGGGSELIYKQFVQKMRASTLNNPVFANAQGFKEVADIVFSE